MINNRIEIIIKKNKKFNVIDDINLIKVRKFHLRFYYRYLL